MSGEVSAGYVSLACAVGEEYGIARSDLLQAAGLLAEDLRDPNALVGNGAFTGVLRFILRRTGDRALGLRMARVLDLRTQGFWGYALLASSSMRERVEVHQRYQALRAGGDFSFWVENDLAILEVRTVNDAGPDLLQILVDCIFAITCMQHRRLFPDSTAQIDLWFTYLALPHHEELRALARGRMVFDAPVNRIQYPAKFLDVPLPGRDPYLSRLATAQLDSQLASLNTAREGDLLEQVRRRIDARLGHDPSIEGVARDLDVSPRTLRRRLDAHDASFQDLLEQARRERAIEYLVGTNEAIGRVSAMVGYRDPSNFRRAFRRWTGLAPATYRSRRAARSDSSGRK